MNSSLHDRLDGIKQTGRAIAAYDAILRSDDARDTVDVASIGSA
jgi:hypothetical protein